MNYEVIVNLNTKVNNSVLSQDTLDSLVKLIQTSDIHSKDDAIRYIRDNEPAIFADMVAFENKHKEENGFETWEEYDDWLDKSFEVPAFHLVNKS